MLNCKLKEAFFLWVVISVFATQAAFAVPSYVSDVPFIKIFDPALKDFSNWKNDDEKGRLSFYSFEGMGTVQNSSNTERAWGAMYRPVSVDLDQHPILQINVLHVSKQWYLILSGPQFPDGYIRLIETKDTGLFSFDIPKLTNLSGKLSFDIKIGMRNPAGGALTDEKVSFDKLVFLSRGPSEKKEESRKKKVPVQKDKGPLQENNNFELLTPDVDLWQEYLKDSFVEVRFDIKDGLGVLRGKMNERNWGAVHRQVTVDLKQFPLFEINVTGCSKNWYLILSSPNLPQGYLRLIETDKAGIYKFDVARLSGLSGPQTFDLQIGVSYPNGASIKGEWMTFDLLRFKKYDETIAPAK